MPKQIKETPLNSSVVFQRDIHKRCNQERKEKKKKNSFPPRSIHHIA